MENKTIKNPDFKTYKSFYGCIKIIGILLNIIRNQQIYIGTMKKKKNNDTELHYLKKTFKGLYNDKLNSDITRFIRYVDYLVKNFTGQDVQLFKYIYNNVASYDTYLDELFLQRSNIRKLLLSTFLTSYNFEANINKLNYKNIVGLCDMLLGEMSGKFQVDLEEFFKSELYLTCSKYKNGKYVFKKEVVNKPISLIEYFLT